MDRIRTVSREIIDLADSTGIPELDLTLIAMNMEGAVSHSPLARSRMQVRPLGSSEIWQIILPLDSDCTAFSVQDRGIYLGETRVAEILAAENDDVVLTYLRAGGRSVTLNTHSRSTCVGCVFCPNIIEDASDATIASAEELQGVLTWLCAEQGWADLSAVEKITVCTGCFNTPTMAINHMADLRTASARLGFSGVLHLLSSVIRDYADLSNFAQRAGPAHLTITVECFSRRDVLLKSSKASLTLERAREVLTDARRAGIIADFTYVAGLDPLDVALHGLERLIPVCDTFPRIQVYQSHNSYMRGYRNPEAEHLAYFAKLRLRTEGILASEGLIPRSWENYRPLWYSSFARGMVAGPRV